ncbi:ComF family protein [Anaerotignum sp.]|uniref:ComF family protein n=1 Tax=Anaerotignum sp. TaxID=2039241 RepID=UPI003320A656
MRNLIRGFLNVLYPPYCVICGELLSIQEWDNGLCDKCNKKLPFLTGNRCNFCGRRLQFGEVCHSCLEHRPVFERGISVFDYEVLRQGIARFKFDGVKGHGEVFGGIMVQYLLLNHPEWLEQVDFMTGVPLHKHKEKERGFNQADILCKIISENTGIPYRDKVLTRTKATRPQSELSAKERHENLKNVFIAQDCLDKQILLVDDILTTGTTLNECSRALYRAGAKKVSVFCLSVRE